MVTYKAERGDLMLRWSAAFLDGVCKIPSSDRSISLGKQTIIFRNHPSAAYSHHDCDRLELIYTAS